MSDDILEFPDNIPEESEFVPPPPSRHVAICIPSPGTVTTGFCSDLVRAVSYHITTTLDQISVLHRTGSLLVKVRDELARKALEIRADATIWLDADMRFPPETFARLLGWDEHPIVGVNAPRRKEPCSGTAYVVDRERQETISPMPLTRPGEDGPEELVPAAAVGFGVVKIDTQVFNRIERPWFTTQWLGSDEGYLGEDVGFCVRARDAGIPIMCDLPLSETIGHTGQKDFTLEDARVWQSRLSES